jgi:dsRNA-specific ribonuclease
MYNIGIYQGNRGAPFKTLLSKLLEKGNIAQKYINILLEPSSLQQFSVAFTHETAHPTQNYELLETLGDQTANKCILWYFSKRFPHIFCPQGSDIITRIKIKYIQSDSFSEISDKLGFWDYISMNMETRTGDKRHKILEDVFESFIAVVEMVLDARFKVGVGYAVCFELISNIMDEMNVSIDYLSLNNPITILKEIFDKLISSGQRDPQPKDSREHIPKYITSGDTVNVYDRIKGQLILIGTGKGKTPELSKQEAAKNAIESLKSQGISKKVPDAYIRFCN